MGIKYYDKQFKEQAVKLSYQRGSVNALAFVRKGVTSKAGCKDQDELIRKS